MSATSLPARTLDLFRGTPLAAREWIGQRTSAGILEPLLLIAVGGGLYGAALGAWRAPLLAVYAAIKLPLLLTATAATDALLNGLWARWLGLELTLGQSLRAVLLTFGFASVVLGAFAPIVLFFDLTLPPPTARDAWTGHDVLGLAHVAAVACAGSVAVVRQHRWIRELHPGAPAAGRVVVLWLAINLFVGAQLSWNLRPWFGSPGMRVEFLRDHPFDGTFYESVFRMTGHHAP